ncbi:hypothetical protein HPB49_022216 [Dermacentor silvarum]|uniref:Uncharacterized protein n=1 Tax=Dermacentor silvarum TaxID=543639 RepID=A0ACB8CBL4_DERSI|nr:hypothetical protein HPB49_022216 [Dermacentor silvarum]
METTQKRTLCSFAWKTVGIRVFRFLTAVLSLRLHPFAFPEKTIVGTQVSATCTTVEAAQNVRFRWFKNGRLLTGSERDGRIRLRTFPDVSTLVIGPLEENDSGNYTCTGTADLKSDSYTQILRVLVPPKWIHEPSDVNVREGDNVTVRCSASGRPTPVVKWKRKGDKGGQGHANTSHGGTLKISRTTKLASGVYICTADNGLPQVLEREIRITIFGRSKGMFRLQPFSFPSDPTEGNKVTVTCALVTGGITSGVEFSWYKDGKALALDDRVKIRSFPDMSTLVVDSLKQEDSGNYTCMGRLGGRKDSHTEQLRVLVPVKWLRELHDVSVKENENTTLRCEATGIPKPSIKWEKEGVLLSASGSKLELSKASKGDSGLYKCTADNGLREPLAKEVRVTVYEFKLQPFRFPSDAVEGKIVTVTCTTTAAVSGVQYRWFKGNQQISEGSKIRLRSYPELSALIVGPLEESDSGNYTCRGVYNGKRDSFSDALHVLVPPKWIEAPEDTIKVMEGTNLTIPCRAKGKPEPTVTVVKQGNDPVTSPNTLQINKSAREHSGLYICKAENALNQPLIKQFRVMVYGSLRLQPFFFPSKVVVGNTVTITCTTISSTANVNFRWLKDGKELAKSAKVKIVYHSLFSTLVVGPTTTEDSGNYTCVGNMGQELDSHSQQLNILGDPKETKAPGRNQLQIRNASKADAGSYECSADNEVPEALTKTVLISIYGFGRTVKVQPFSFPANLVEGSRVSATCSLLRVSEGTRFMWSRNGKVLGRDSEGRIKTRTETDFSMITIDPARQEDSGNYSCTAISKGKSDTHSANLVIYAAPKWTQRPSNVMITEGNNVSVLCAASGNPVPDVVLRKTEGNGQAKAEGKGKATMAITKSTKMDDGTYTCAASNGFGADIHEKFFVKVYEKIDVVPFYIKERVMLGDTVKIVCYTSTVQAPLSFKWIKDGKILVPNDNVQIKTQADLSTIILGPVEQTHAGNYTCQVLSPTSSGSYTAPLVIYAPPGWLIEPRDQRVARGSNLTISCVASGQPTPKTTWKHMSGSRMNSLKTSPDGRLHLTNIQKEDQGTYSCTASNEVGSPLEKTITISVTDPPEIQPIVFPKNLKEGAKFRAFCSVTGVPPFTFKWRKNNHNLPEDDTVLTENAQDYSSLVIKKLRKSHAGNYTCTAMNRGGATRYTAELIVNAPPAWTVEPSSGMVLLGDKLEIGCQSHGYPEPTVAWAKRGVSGGTLVSGTTNGTLLIQNATRSDGGTYVCTAVNSYGERLEKEITVRVIVPARFEEKFKVQTVRRGEAATLQCQAIGDSPLEITWSQDKKRLIFAPVTRYEKFESNTENGVTSELAIPTTDRSDAALYTCVAKNEYGSDERNIKLLVVEVPAQPLDLRILEVWSRKVNVIWSEPYSGNSPISSYIVHYWRDRDGAHRLMEQTVPSSQSSAMISELHPGASYSLTVTAENEVGQGPPSDPVRFLTAEEEPGGSPTDVWAAAKGPTSIAVSWKPPPRDTWNGVLKGYYVGYRAAESSQPYSFKTVETVVNGSQEVTLVGLSKSSRYSVIVKAFNAIGSGPPSEALLVRTLDGDVPFAPALTLISSTDSAFKVKWTHSKATAAPVTGYTLHYKKNAGPWHHIPVVASDDTSYTLTDLDGGATYKVYLTASNQFGRGSGSEAIIINTTNEEKRNRSDYATIQSRRSLSGSYKIEELRSAAPNRGYNTTDAKDRRRSSLRKSSASSHVYDSAANGRRLEAKDGSVTDNVDFSVLKIESLEVDSSGNYTCVVTNLVGSASQSAALTVHGRKQFTFALGSTAAQGSVRLSMRPFNFLAPPRWIQEPTSAVATWGETVWIPCQASGHPAPTILWTRNGQAMAELQHSSNGTLILTSTDKSDSGEYKCEASNGIGQPLPEDGYRDSQE